MIPVYQTKFGEGHGNCMAAALASLLEIDIESVPNFAEYGSLFWDEVSKWLAERNLAILTFNVDEWDQNNREPEGYHLMGVKSPRGNFLHTLVGYKGVAIHDPHPAGYCQHEGIVNYDILYPIDPSKPIGIIL